MYQLFCDSNCELWHTTVKELGLNVIKMPYTVDGTNITFYDMGENTDFEGFFKAMREGATPKTQALNESEYIDYFEPVLARGEDIYYVAFSSQMSGTFNAMNSAINTLKEKYPDRTIMCKDTKTICMGTGLIVYYAAKKYKEGATMSELDEYLTDLVEHTATYFAVEDLTYLYRGGRVSGVSKVVGNLLGLKPVLYFNEEGKILNIAKPKGFKKALSTLKDYITQKGSELDKYAMVVLHADNEKIAKAFADDLQATFNVPEMIFQPIGPVIGSHAGPGTIAVMFHSKER